MLLVERFKVPLVGRFVSAAAFSLEHHCEGTALTVGRTIRFRSMDGISMVGDHVSRLQMYRDLLGLI